MGAWYVVTEEPGGGKGTQAIYVVAQKPFQPGQIEVGGPYPTKMLAEASLKKKTSQASHFNIPPIIPKLTGIDAIGDFFSRLTSGATWIRVGEVVAGGIILFIGIHALTVNTAASSAAKSVTKPAKKATKTVVKVAFPEATPAIRAANARAKVAAKNPTVRTSHIYHHTVPKAKVKK